MLTWPCNALRTSSSIARSDTSVVIDNEPYLSRMCKTSLVFAFLAVRFHAGSSTFPFNTPTNPLIRFHSKLKNVSFPKFKTFFLF